MVSMAAWLDGVLRRTSPRLRRLAPLRRLAREAADPSETLSRLQDVLAQTVAQGAAGRRWLTGGLDVTVDEIDATVPALPSSNAGESREDGPDRPRGTVVTASTWARRMVITARDAPRSMLVVVLHRQALEPCAEACEPRTSPSEATRSAGTPQKPQTFPVIILAGHVSPDDDRRVLAIPNAEEHLPRLTCAADGRIVVDRTTAQYRPEYAGRFDELDAVVADICRDPLVATLLQDWVATTSRRR